MHGLHPRSPKVVKLVHRLHQGSPRVVELEVMLYHGCLGVVKLEVRLHQGCFIREQEVFQGGEGSDRASTHKLQGGGVHDELHYGNSKESEARIGASR